MQKEGGTGSVVSTVNSVHEEMFNMGGMVVLGDILENGESQKNGNCDYRSSEAVHAL